MSAQHECVDCRALAEKPITEGGLELPPARPRPAPYGGPRSRRCATHHRAHRAAQKARQHAAYVAKQYGLSKDEQAALWSFQGKRCPCGRTPTRMPDTDHDHSCCDGPTSCGRCVRGLLCRACNKDVIGRYSAAQLRALADYLDDPPAAQLRRAGRLAA